MAGLDIFQEANRQLTICNACRYCEGLCPVFPALEMRRSFTETDIRYLANLCHDCRACHQACMFTEPHEFAMNFPKAMSEVRIESYRHWSWPAFLAQLFSRPSAGALLGTAAAALVLLSSLLLIPRNRLVMVHPGPGAFYQIVPYPIMVIVAVLLCLYGAAIWLQGSIRFWVESYGHLLRRSSGIAPIFHAVLDAMTVKHLDGGGPGCAYPKDAPSQVRRVFHSLVFWGFLLDFASTIFAFIYQDFYLIQPPYALLSIPVLLGSVGGVGLIVGCTGLLWLKFQSDRLQAAAVANSLDSTFLLFLGLSGLTGILTLALRSTPAMGAVLVVHLATVAALFITAPYGKFVHFVYRTFALIRFQIEAQEPGPHDGHH
jgi:citrate/tricarballylate utilization protein